MAFNAFNLVIFFVIGEFLSQVNANPLSKFIQRNRNDEPRVVSPGYAIIALVAFALFILLMVLIVFYRRDKGVRGDEKTLFLTPY